MDRISNNSPWRFSVAPMMDWTDRHCRYLHRLMTRRARLYTEMLTTGAVIHGDRARLMGFDAFEQPLAFQLGGSEPRDVNHQVTQQIQAQFTGFQLLNEGDLQVSGHPSHGTTATGINPKGERVSVLVLSINAGSGHFLTVISSSPNDQAKAVNATVMQMAQSIRFAGE